MPRAKETDLPGVEGPGVSQVKDKTLEKLADEFIEVRDEKAALAEKLGKVESKLLDRMNELNITRYRFSDQEAVVKTGKNHVKIKTVKAEDDGEDEEPGGD